MSNGYGRDRKRDQDNVITNIISEIGRLNSLNDLKPKKYADEKGYADKIAEYFSGRGNDSKVLNTNQLRKFFGAIRDIESTGKNWEDIEAEFYLLKPKLAVSVGRELIPSSFYKLMMKCMKKIDVGSEEEKMDNFEVFVNFLEAIVAYRKYHDKK
jgi:CRISPR-associated protein Csm2